MYKIIGEYKGKKEILDTANNEASASYKAFEYFMAFSKEWTIYWERITH
jgi:hypothetical protein